jgi:SAM-dependent methyltransferase
MTLSPSAFAERYEQHRASGLMEAYYGGSGFFNVGYWDATVRTPREASARLLSEICAPLPASVKSILDVGCGSGATTAALRHRYPEANVTGGDVSLRQLIDRRGTACLDGSLLPFREHSLDAIVAVESVPHFASRRAFLRDAALCLRPNGWLVFSDMLISDTSSLGSWMFPSSDAAVDLDRYRASFDERTWLDVRLRDATVPCWGGFCDAWERWIESLGLERDERDAHRRVVSRWRGEAVAHYLIVAARRGDSNVQ